MKVITKLVLMYLMSLSFFSCTDLEEETLLEESETTNLIAGVDPDEVLTTAYNSLNGIIGDQANTFALSEVTTDAAIVPTRGDSWGDNGIWRQLHQHNWIVDHQFINTAWDQWNEIHCLMERVIDPGSNATSGQLGDAHFLRSLASFMILDNFAQLPICTSTSTSDDEVFSGADAVTFILTDLDQALSNLPEVSVGGSNLNRATKSAARYLKAKVLLNKHIYEDGTPDPEDLDEVVSLIDLINANGYDLQQGYFDIFRESADSETIWYLEASVSNRIYNGLHYNQVVEAGGGGWNGFATLSEYYDLFEGNPDSNRPNNNQEERRGFTATEGTPFTSEEGTTESGSFPGFTASSSVGYGFLAGQQFEINCAMILDRTGEPLDFTRTFLDSDGNSSLIENSETTGIRLIKYHPQFDNGFTNHEIFFRYSDAHLMKAEAIFRMSGDALPLINELRVLREATPLTTLTAQDIIDERGRELYMEIWRRNDLIRFGQYTRDWELKDPAAVGNSNLEVFPIPTAALMENPNLVQNQGY